MVPLSVPELAHTMDEKNLEPWARPLKKLFQIWPPDFEEECEYNHQLALKEPYCCVCQLFKCVSSWGSGLQANGY